MSDAPERIWTEGSLEWNSGLWGRNKDFYGDVEYVRADRIEELEAKLADMADAVWAEFKGRGWEGEKKYALREVVKWLKKSPGDEAEAVGQSQGSDT